MNNYYSSSTSSGLGTLDVLQLIFIVLKIADLVSWSWLAVFTPLFAQLGLLLIELIPLFFWED